jgi:PKD repeat protein
MPTPLVLFSHRIRRGVFPVLVPMLLCVSVRAVELPVLSDPLQTTQGNPVQGAPGIYERMDAITARDKSKEVAAHAKHSYLFRTGPSTSAGTGTNGSLPAGPSGPNIQTLNSNLNFTAATFSDCSGWPPDTMGAVGPTQFITALNGRVRSFNKTNGVADGGINLNTDVFFQSVMTPPATNNFTTDPRIRYDRLSGRWFIIMIDVPGLKGTKPNRVMLAMSDSGTITASTVWTFFQFAGDASNFADYPTLGIDANALYIGANIFSTSGGGGLVNTTGFVVRKSSLLSGGPIVVTPFTGLITISGHPPHQTDAGPFTPQGVDNFDPNATEGYFIGADISSASTLQLRRVSNPGGTPSLSGNVSISVNSFASPISVTVSGTSGTIDGLDTRLLSAHYRNGALWTSHNVGVNSSGGTSSPDRNGVNWYQLTNIPTGQTPAVLQTGTVFQSSSNLSYWMGTVMVSGQGHVAMGCTAAGPTSFLNAAWAGRLVGDAAGTMSTPVLYTASTSAYSPGDGSNPHRWGDYSFTSLDPSDDMTMWTIQEWCSSSGNGFAVQATQILAPLPATPVNCSPGSVAAGSSGVNVVVTGQVNSGSGFFDPGVGFAKHIAAAVSSGDVTVNSVTYNNPTNITLNISVSPTATAGTRFITVTNPDGQTMTSSTGILSITSTNPPPPPAASFTAGPTIGVAPLTVNFTNASTGATNYNWSFGDGHVSTSTNPTNTYTNAGTYTVTLTAIGAGGTNSVTNVNYIVVTNPPPPVASFTGSPTNGLAPLAVTFANASSGATNYSWNFGDGNVSAATNPAHTYTNAGSYTVKLTAVGAGGTNSVTNVNYIVVTNPPPPIASFTGSPTNGLAPLTVTFANASSGATNYSWNFGDGNVSAATNPAHTYTNAGTYSVKLTAVGAGGTNSLTNVNYIVVTNPPPPVASFTGSPTNGLAPLAVTFANASTGATNYSWNFGDGNVSTALNPAHIYTNAGIYTVTLTAVGAGGANSVTNVNYIVVTNPPPPIASFTGSPTNGLAPLTVNFTNTSTGATNYSWSFGDGNISTSINPTNTYTNAGIYTVTLTAVGAGGTNSITNVNYIVVTNPPPPVVSFTGSPTNGAAPLTVNFANSSSGATNYSWGFGDGNSSGATNPVNTYTNAGAYSVTLTAIGAGGTNNLTLTNYIVVTNPPPVVAFVASPTNGGAPLTVFFTNSTVGATNYSWGFGDGQTNAAANPTNIYQSQGSYTVTLTAFGPGGQGELVQSNYIVLSNSPPVLAAIANKTVHPGMTVIFTNSATDPDVNQSLNFSLDPGAPANASVDSGSGVFTWTPDRGFANTTNTITVRVTDNGTPPLSAAQSLSVAVVPLAFQPVSLSNGVLTISWESISGVTYRVQYITNLGGSNWSDLPPNVTATEDTAITTDSIGTDMQRFYRVVVVP